MTRYRMTGHSNVGIVLTFLVTLVPVAFAAAQSPAEHFADNIAGSTIVVDHEDWNVLLETYLDSNHPSGINLFDYAAVTSADQERLDSYIEELQQVDVPGLNRDEQMAYWINFYNALTVKVILDNFPVESIRDISLPGSRGGPWKAKLVSVMGMELSLDDIEHGILRPIWKDARIHYAVNCASMGCPNLAAGVYTAENLEEFLDAAAGAYVNHPRGVDRNGRRLYLSSIYNWYKEDFGNRTELETHLLKYADPETAEKIRGASGRISYGYDWNLNTEN